MVKLNMYRVLPSTRVVIWSQPKLVLNIYLGNLNSCIKKSKKLQLLYTLQLNNRPVDPYGVNKRTEIKTIKFTN